MRALFSLPLLASLTLLLSCGGEVRRFGAADPMWEDRDQNHTTQRPESFYSGLLADGADQMLFRPISYIWSFPRPGEAANVNAIDEIPNSAWFTNRIGMHELTPERVARGACGDTPTLTTDTGPWEVSAAKPNGANPGFFIKAGDGHRYLLKFDGPQQPTRATGSDVIGSKIFWAAGYFTPCNEVVHFDPKHLRIAEDATAETIFGEDRPITQADVDKVLAKALRSKDGLLRASPRASCPVAPSGPSATRARWTRIPTTSSPTRTAASCAPRACSRRGSTTSTRGSRTRSTCG